MNIYITISIIVSIILLFYLLIKLNKNIRQKAYRLFLYAENNLLGGNTKMDYVVQNVYYYLPSFVKLFISTSTLEKIIQKMFDEIKDLLDDGKRNKSIERNDK